MQNGNVFSQLAFETLFHLSRCFIGESNSHNILRADRFYLKHRFQVFRNTASTGKYRFQFLDIIFRDGECRFCTVIGMTEHDHINNSSDNGRRFAASGSCQHKNRAIYIVDSLFLHGVHGHKLGIDILLSEFTKLIR